MTSSAHLRPELTTRRTRAASFGALPDRTVHGWPRAGALLVAVAAATIVAACGSAAPTTAHASAANLAPCSMLSRSDAAAALGRPVQPGHAVKAVNDPSTGNSCTYLPAVAGARGSVSLMFFGFPSSSAAQNYFERLEAARPQTQTATGVAQKAFLLAADPGSGTLIFLDNATLGEVVITDADGDHVPQSLQDLARRVVAQM